VAAWCEKKDFVVRFYVEVLRNILIGCPQDDKLFPSFKSPRRLQMAEGLAEMGADLAICARKKERCEAAAEGLHSHGVRMMALGCDVRDKADIQEVVEKTLAEFGHIDILINNAGVS